MGNHNAFCYTIMSFSIILLTLIVTVWCEQTSYEGYKVYTLRPSGREQVDLLSTLTNNKHFDVWSPLRLDGSSVDVMVDPAAQTIFEKFLEVNSVKFTIGIDDVETAIQEERTHQLKSRSLNGTITFTKYHRHAEINAYLDQLGRDHPDIVSLETIGKSYEGRDLKLIKISTNYSANKPVIFIDGGIHAREWAAPPVPLYVINQLVENSQNVNLLDKVDYHILPVVNPDGYEYTHVMNRLWRKTRSLGSLCHGTDGNRNFEYHWAEVGSSNLECSETYHGTHPFSEAETAALRDYVLRNKDSIKLYLTFHTYGQLILYPWSYTAELPEDHEELQAVGELAAKSIEAVAGTTYVVGSSTNVLYATAGSSDDWVKGVGGVALSYTIELPGGGAGFVPPPSEILPIVTETWEGVKAFGQYVSNKFG